MANDNTPLQQGVTPLCGDEENYLLACMLKDKTVIDLISPIINKYSHFDNPINGKLFECIMAVHKEKKNTADLFAVKAEMVRRGLNIDDPLTYITGLVSNVGSPTEFVLDRARTVRANADRLQTLLSIQEVAKELQKPGADTEQYIGLLHSLSIDSMAPPKTFAKFLEEKWERDMERTGDLLGFALSDKFKRMCGQLEGIQPGLYIIGAATNVGKTAFLVSIFLDIIGTNEHARGIFLTLDDSKDKITDRILSHKSGLTINQVPKIRKLRPGNGANPSKEYTNLRGAYETFKQLSRVGRMSLLDGEDIQDFTGLNSLIRVESKKDDHLFMVVDGLHNLEVGDSYGGIREQNIARAQKIKSLSANFNIPLIATAELHKNIEWGDSPNMSALMETGKFAYNADIVFLLYPNYKHYEKEHGKDKAEASFNEGKKPLLLLLKTDKNKLSSDKGENELTFIPNRATIAEMSDRVDELGGSATLRNKRDSQ